SDVSLATIVMSRSRVARLLAEAVERGEYSFEPGELRTIRARNKMREVFSCRLTDLIVHGVVANLVQEAVAADVSPRVFSYRKGLASLTPITQFARYLRTERRQHDDPRKRGVYVLRCDVDSYTDSIPIGRDSPLWAMLEARLGVPHSRAADGAADRVGRRQPLPRRDGSCAPGRSRRVLRALRRRLPLRTSGAGCRAGGGGDDHGHPGVAPVDLEREETAAPLPHASRPAVGRVARGDGRAVRSLPRDADLGRGDDRARRQEGAHAASRDLRARAGDGEDDERRRPR